MQSNVHIVSNGSEVKRIDSSQMFRTLASTMFIQQTCCLALGGKRDWFTVAFEQDRTGVCACVRVCMCACVHACVRA